MNYFLKKFQNGLKVLCIPMKDRHSAGVAVWVRTGARYETEKIAGVSHFMEHMLFKGTQKRTTKQIKEEIEGVGGILNAFTSEEHTCYFAKLLVPHYAKALDVLSDMVNHATLEQKEFDKEKPVILEEIKMYHDLPAHHVHDLMGQLLWPGQPLGRPIAGTLESVSGINRGQMVAYKEKFYHPKNILVSVSGDVEPEKVCALAEEAFGGKVKQKPVNFLAAVNRQLAPQTLFIEKKTEQTHFVVGFHGLSRFDEKRYILGILNVILGSNMSSRLFEEIREKRGLAYEIKSGLSFYYDTGALTISAGTETKKTPQAIAVILKELNKLIAKGVTPGELRRAKDYYKSQIYMGMEDTLDYLLWIGEKAVDSEELPDTDKICLAIDRVTQEEVKEMAGNVFKAAHMNLSLIGPVDEKMQKQIKNSFSME